MPDLRVTQRRSAIGTRPKQRGTLRALGLGKIGRSNVLPDRPEIRGMIATVPHLVAVEEVEGGRAEEPSAEKAPAKKAPAKKAATKKTTAKKAPAKKAATKKASSS